ncbi:MAG: phasin family protein [Bradyrhizobiaceae bacterium]|nr:phasin family protein [Bradyrhizobiaceae bacterium]
MRHQTQRAVRLSRDPIEAAEQAAQPSIDLLLTNVEAFQRAVASTMDFMVQMAEQNANGPARVSENLSSKTKQLAQQWSGNGVATSTMTGALSDIWGEWVSFMQKCARHNVDHWKVLFSCRTPHDFVKAQSELLRGDMEDVLESGRRIAEKSMRLGSVGRNVAATAERIFPTP